MQPTMMDGSQGPIQPFNEKVMNTWLENPEVREVKVFRLTKGMILNIEDLRYKVVAVRDNGKATIKLVGSPKVVAK